MDASKTETKTETLTYTETDTNRHWRKADGYKDKDKHGKSVKHEIGGEKARKNTQRPRRTNTLKNAIPQTCKSNDTQTNEITQRHTK